MWKINGDRGTYDGRLITKLTDESSGSDTQWLVSTISDVTDEKIVFESAFGSKVGKIEPGKPKHQSKSGAQTKRNKKHRKGSVTSVEGSPSVAVGSKNVASLSRSSSPSNGVVPSASSKASPSMTSSPEDNNLVGGTNKRSKTKKKRKAAAVSTSSAGSTTVKAGVPSEPPSDSSGLQKNSAAAARAARSLRRQAKLEEENSKRMLFQDSGPPNKKSKTKDSNVVRVPFAMGTLLLYQGPRRRAEFIFKK